MAGNRIVNGPVRARGARNSGFHMSVQKESGESQGAKQTRGHDCLPFRGAAESSAYGVWRFQSALEISSEWLFSYQRSGSQMTMGLAEAGCEMHFTLFCH